MLLLMLVIYNVYDKNSTCYIYISYSLYECWQVSSWAITVSQTISTSFKSFPTVEIKITWLCIFLTPVSSNNVTFSRTEITLMESMKTTYSIRRLPYSFRQGYYLYVTFYWLYVISVNKSLSLSILINIKSEVMGVLSLLREYSLIKKWFLKLRDFFLIILKIKILS